MATQKPKRTRQRRTRAKQRRDRSRTGPVQLSLEDAMPKPHGGARPGAGRPKGRNVSHDAREEFSPRIPQHVTLRLVAGVPSLRRDDLVRFIRGQIAMSHLSNYRVVHFTVQDNHLHLICEADGKAALSRGVQQMESRIARRLNRAMGRRGRFFDDRFHRRSLSTPREVRNALCYVLNNERHHADERGTLLSSNWFDPYSSAAWFDGWGAPLPSDEDWKRVLLAMPSPVAPPQTWLLATGWRKRGLIRLDEVPGRRASRKPPRRA